MDHSDRTRRGAAARIRRARERRRAVALAAELAEVRRRDAWRAGLVSTLGHDLRAPLATVVSMARLLRTHGEELSPQRRDELIRSITRQAQRSLMLADDLLDLALLEEGELVLRREQVGLEELVRGALLDLDPDVRIDIPPGLVLSCDPGRLGQVVANLVDNARRYGEPPIDVVARRLEGIVSLVVRDTGPGVPDHLVDRLFTRFAAGDHPDSVGLGLWIASQITAAHGGDLDYRNGTNGGAEFVLRLPDDPLRQAT